MSIRRTPPKRCSRPQRDACTGSWELTSLGTPVAATFATDACNSAKRPFATQRAHPQYTENSTGIAMNNAPFDVHLAEKILQGVRAMHQIRLPDPRERDLAIVEARRNRDWMRLVFLHDPTAWIDALEQHAGEMDDGSFWQVLRRVYTHVPAAFLYYDRLVRLFASRPATDAGGFELDDLRTFNDLPDPFRIYRGYAEPYSVGLSWSLSLRIAKFFAYLAAERSADPLIRPQLLTGLACKKDVLTLIEFRSEREVIIHSNLVTKKKRRTLGPLRGSLEDLIA